MIPKAERNTQVTAATLEHRDEAPRRPRMSDDDELETLKARIAAARTLAPTDDERHCLDCFQKGRDAALRAIDGDHAPRR